MYGEENTVDVPGGALGFGSAAVSDVEQFGSDLWPLV